MAITPQNNEVFLREVGEEVRREQMARMARRYGPLIGGLVLLVLAALAAFLIWRNHQETQSATRAEHFDGAMSDLSAGRPADARKTFETLAASGARGYSSLARLMLADMGIQDGKDADADGQFMKVAQDQGAPQPLRDLALIRATTLDFDRIAPDEVINRLKPLAVAGNPWFGTAGELTGLGYMKLNQPKKAGALFVAIANDKTVPASIRGRVAQLAGDLGFTAVQPADSSQP